MYIHSFQFYTTYLGTVTQCHVSIIPMILIWPADSLYGIKIAGRNINSLRYAEDTTLMAESERELKSLVMKVKKESGKSWLKA